MPSEYELPTETGEQRYQRLIDAHRTWVERWLLLAAVVLGTLWMWYDGWFKEGWNLLWMLPLLFAAVVISEKIGDRVDSALAFWLSPLTRAFRNRGYSYYDDEARDPAPDYSMAEVIVPEPGDERER